MRKTLLKLTHCINFINIFCAHFLYEFKRQSQNVARKAAKKDICTKKAREKTLMKSTPSVNFINIIRVHFLYESLFKAKTYLEKAAETTFVRKIRT